MVVTASELLQEDSTQGIEITEKVALGRRLGSQVERRLLQGKKILHGEKIFSVFEPIRVGSSKVSPVAASN